MGSSTGAINYIFCSDDALLRINKDYLNHDFFTDIITFEYEEEQGLSGDIFISVERVRDNASIYNDAFDNELRRVMIHGILHLQGLSDKTEREKTEMRSMEERMMDLFHVKH